METRRTKVRPFLDRREKELMSDPTPGQARVFQELDSGAVWAIVAAITFKWGTFLGL